LYYFNTNDGQGEIDVTSEPLAQGLIDDEACDSCTI